MLKTSARHARTAFPEPEFGEPLEAAFPSEELAQFMLRRRSTPIKGMSSPGPTAADLTLILRAGARVPDHGKLAPFRFLTFKGKARKAFGDVLADVWKANHPHATDDHLDMERRRFLEAPIAVAVISQVRENHKIPEWEQVLCAGAVCQNMLIMAQALGYASQWLTGWYAYDRDVKRALGLESGERIAGYLFFGTATDNPQERVRPNLKSRIQTWTPPS